MEISTPFKNGKIKKYGPENGPGRYIFADGPKIVNPMDPKVVSDAEANPPTFEKNLKVPPAFEDNLEVPLADTYPQMDPKLLTRWT